MSSDFGLRFPRVHEVISEGITRGLHSGCQLYVSQNGNVQADIGVGESRPGIAMTSDTINLWLSAGKPLTAVAVMQQWEQGRLQLDDRVARFLPEFAAGGKREITLRHVLTHTGGFRNIEINYPEASWDDILDRICAGSLEQDWIVGRTAGYHTTTSWFVLGEILHRVTGQPFAGLMRDQLFYPLGMNDSWSAIPNEQYTSYGDRIGTIFVREQGQLKLLDWHSPARCAAPSPGSNSRGPVRELGRFYEMLLNDGAGPQGKILMPQTVAAMTARHRVGEFDQTLGHVVDFGLGVIVDSNRYGIDTVPYGYGRYCSPRTFGHGGAQSSQGWCDPEVALVVAYYFNGRAGEGQHQRRAKALNEAIYLDLGLVDSQVSESV